MNTSRMTFNLWRKGFLPQVLPCGCLAVILLGSPPETFGDGTVNPCTQAALETALIGGGLVEFHCAGVITLNKTLVISQDTTLEANGNEVTLSGGGLVRLFEVQSGVTLVINGLDLVHGRHLGANGVNGIPSLPSEDGQGACVLNLGGTVILNHCVVSDHLAQGGNGPLGSYIDGGQGQGGAIYTLGGQVSLTNCTLQNNIAMGGLGGIPPEPYGPSADPGEAYGGALFSNGGRVDLVEVTMILNRASGGASQWVGFTVSSRGGNAAGGGVYVTNSNLLISHAVLQNNAAVGARVGGFSYGGSGFGGAVFLAEETLGTILHSSFAGNTGTGGHGGRHSFAGTASGGALFNLGHAAVFDSTFTTNRTTGGAGNPIAGDGRGGALASAGFLAVSGCTFNMNVSEALNVRDTGMCEIPLPGSHGIGGAVWSSGTLAVTNSTFSANQANGGNADCGGVGGSGIGGAISVQAGTAVLLNVTLAENRVGGGKSHLLGGVTNGATLGGALASTNGTVRMFNSILAYNGGSNAWGEVMDGGYNMSTDDTPAFSAPGSVHNTDPLLEALADNGGPTPTRTLLLGSPARDVIPREGPPLDQRGLSRPQGLASDMGAVEVVVPVLEIARVDGNVRVLWPIPATGPIPATAFVLEQVNNIDGSPLTGWTLVPIPYQANATHFYIDVPQPAESMFYRLRGVSPLVILQSPRAQAVDVGSDATFSVHASGNGALSYQWLFSGAIIAGATSAMLTIPNAQIEHEGAYSVIVTDSIGQRVTSGMAVLSVGPPRPPTIVAHPQDMIVQAGDTATFSVTATNNASLPIRFVWHKQLTPVHTNTLFQFTSTYSITNVQPDDAGRYYRCVLHNTATTPIGVPSRVANLTVE